MLPSTFKWNLETLKTEIPTFKEYPYVWHRFQIISPEKTSKTKPKQNNSRQNPTIIGTGNKEIFPLVLLFCE